MTSRLHSTLRHLRREETGTAAVEFSIVFPIVLFLFMWAVEIGLLMTKQVMLEFSMDVAMRELRLGQMENPDADTLKQRICANARIISTCQETIMIEMNPIDTATWELPAVPVSCRNREEEIEPVVSFNPGVQNEIMLVRACVIVEPLFPGTGIGAMLQKDALGGYGMAATSAFVNEPT